VYFLFVCVCVSASRGENCLGFIRDNDGDDDDAVAILKTSKEIERVRESSVLVREKFTK
jgi:hypothetical protein